MMSTLHISKEFADLLKRFGEERLMHIVTVWENRNEWQRQRYHKKIKPQLERRKAEIEQLRKIADESSKTEEVEVT
jgi:hypothetical protein